MTVPVSGAPPKADVYLLADTTGSMIPIIGAVQATRRLQDGVTVSVDCSRGIVQIMPQ